jgi:hypothetical protein
MQTQRFHEIAGAGWLSDRVTLCEVSYFHIFPLFLCGGDLDLVSEILVRE